MQWAGTTRITRSKAVMNTVLVTTILFLVISSSAAQNPTSPQDFVSRVPPENRQDPVTTARPLDPEIQPGSDTDFSLLLKAANFGNLEAQTEVGYRYTVGFGVVRDESEAFRWFQRAAVEHYAPAQFDLGYLLLTGRGVQRDLPQAARWFERAAEQGLAPAEVSLAFAYEHGLGITRDQSKALYWARRAAKQHYAPGEFFLGTMYELGRGVPQDFSEAVKWYQRAAKQGYAPAENDLGGLYQDGQGVKKDLEEAIKWYKLAAEQGDEISYTNLAHLYAGSSTGQPDFYAAYFWALLALQNPSPDHGPPSEQFVHQLDSQLSSEQIARIDAQVDDWMRKHPSRVGPVWDPNTSKSRY